MPERVKNWKKFIPNSLTISRAVSTFIITILFFTNIENKFIWIYGFFIFASLTDFLDGFLARKWKVESTFGRVFDSLFDKIFVLVMFMLLIPFNIVHPLFFIALLFREIFIDGIKNYMLSHNKAVAPLMTGKLKMVFQVLMLNFMILFLIFPDTSTLYTSVVITTVLALFFSFYSGFLYTKNFFRYLKP